MRELTLSEMNFISGGEASVTIGIPGVYSATGSPQEIADLFFSTYDSAVDWTSNSFYPWLSEIFEYYR